MAVWRVVCWSFWEGSEDRCSEWSYFFCALSEVCLRGFLYSICVIPKRYSIEIHFENLFFIIVFIESIREISFLYFSFYRTFFREKSIADKLLREGRGSFYFITTTSDIVIDSTAKSFDIDPRILEKCLVFSRDDSIFYMI